MNKLFSIIILLLFTFNSQAQKVLYDIKDNLGNRQVRLKPLGQNMNGKNYKFSVKGYKLNETIDYYLVIQTYVPIPDNTSILIKLGNGEVLTIPINELKTQELLSVYNIPIYNGVYTNNYTLTEKKQLNTILYALDKASIDKIREFGIIKLRIPTGDKKIYNEKEWYDNMLGKHIINSYDKIEHLFKYDDGKSSNDF